MSLIFLCRDSSGTITQILETLDPHHLRKHDAQYSEDLSLSGDCAETCIERCASDWVGHKDKCYKLSDTSETWSVGEKSCRCWIFSKFDSVALETRVDTWLLLAAVMFMTFSSNG